MSKTLEQIYADNPATAIANNDLLYLVQSPYTPGTDAAILGSDLIAQLGGGTINPGLTNQLAYYASSGTTISGLATGVNGVLITSAGGVPSISSTLPNAVQDNITRLGTIVSGTWNGSLISGQYGGTGVNNGSSTITIGGNVTFSGAFTFTGTLTGNTSVTFPTSGTLATTSQLPTPSALTKVDDTNVTLTLGGTPATALLQAVSLTLGWTGTLSGTRGGTGVNNGANTATFAGNLNFASSFTTSGAFAVTQTYTGITNVTFPTSGTLATTSQIPTGAALTKVDDTNVTLTLGGSPTTALVNAASLTLGWTGQLAVGRGGTGASTLTGLLTGNGTSAITATAITQYNVITGGASNAPNSVAPSATSGVPLISQGSSAQPVFGTAVVAGGGTGNTTFTAYSVICAGTTATGAFQNVSGVGTSGQVLTSNGAGALPTWQTNSIAGAALTKTDDTNVTLTLGGSPTTALVNAASLTLGWTGTLAKARGGSGLSSFDPVIQQVSTETGAASTGSTTLPFDDTIPQNTEGNQVMTLAITPTSSSHILVIEVVCIAACSAAANDNIGVALFQDSTANALACASFFYTVAGGIGTVSFRHIMTAGTTSSTTFKVRAGANGAGTLTFNGNAGARKYGGVYASSIMITEYET